MKPRCRASGTPPRRNRAHRSRCRSCSSRGSSILGATHDLADCVRHNGKLLSGTLRLGVIPTLAPYVLPVLLPVVHCTHPDLCLDLLETQTETLVSELAQGTLDVLLLALPLEKSPFETVVLFTDRFLFAVPADDPLPERSRVTPDDVNARRLLLLEEKDIVCANRRSSIAGSAMPAIPSSGQQVWRPFYRWWRAAMV